MFKNLHYLPAFPNFHYGYSKTCIPDINCPKILFFFFNTLKHFVEAFFSLTGNFTSLILLFWLCQHYVVDIMYPYQPFVWLTSPITRSNTWKSNISFPFHLIPSIYRLCTYIFNSHILNCKTVIIIMTIS